jgi:hypothetical protein
MGGTSGGIHRHLGLGVAALDSNVMDAEAL